MVSGINGAGLITRVRKRARVAIKATLRGLFADEIALMTQQFDGATKYMHHFERVARSAQSSAAKVEREIGLMQAAQAGHAEIVSRLDDVEEWQRIHAHHHAAITDDKVSTLWRSYASRNAYAVHLAENSNRLTR